MYIVQYMQTAEYNVGLQILMLSRIHSVWPDPVQMDSDSGSDQVFEHLSFEKEENKFY